MFTSCRTISILLTNKKMRPPKNKLMGHLGVIKALLKACNKAIRRLYLYMCRLLVEVRINTVQHLHKANWPLWPRHPPTSVLAHFTGFNGFWNWTNLVHLAHLAYHDIRNMFPSELSRVEMEYTWSLFSSSQDFTTQNIQHSSPPSAAKRCKPHVINGYHGNLRHPQYPFRKCSEYFI